MVEFGVSGLVIKVLMSSLFGSRHVKEVISGGCKHRITHVGDSSMERVLVSSQ